MIYPETEVPPDEITHHELYGVKGVELPDGRFRLDLPGEKIEFDDVMLAAQFVEEQDTNPSGWCRFFEEEN